MPVDGDLCRELPAAKDSSKASKVSIRGDATSTTLSVSVRRSSDGETLILN